MNIYTVYYGTKDFGDKYVVRRFVYDQPTNETFCDEDLEKVRDWIFENALGGRQGEPIRFPPGPQDDKCIIEVWI